MPALVRRASSVSYEKVKIAFLRILRCATHDFCQNVTFVNIGIGKIRGY